MKNTLYNLLFNQASKHGKKGVGGVGVSYHGNVLCLWPCGEGPSNHGYIICKMAV